MEDIIRHLNREEFTPIVICLRDEDTTTSVRAHFDALGCHVEHLGHSLFDIEIKTRQIAKEVLERLKTEDCCLLHSHGYQPDLIASYMLEEITTISTLHNQSGEDYRYSKGLLMGGYMQRRYLKALRKVDRLVAISSQVIDYYEKRITRPKQISLIYNGIDTDRFLPPRESERTAMRQEFSLPPNATVFASSGSLSKRKDPIILIKSFHTLVQAEKLSRDSYLLLFGSGPLMEECRQIVERIGSNQIRLMGFRKNIATDLIAVDILLSASHSEGFGLNIVEAAAMGLSVAASDIPPHREILAKYPEFEAQFFAVGDQASAQTALLKAYNNFHTQPLTQIAQDIRRRFSAKVMSQAYQELYQDALR